MTGEPTRFSRWGNRISWLLVPLAAVMQFVWLRRPVSIAGVTDPDENRWNTFTQKLLDHDPGPDTAREIEDTRDWRTRNGGPAYEGCSWD